MRLTLAFGVLVLVAAPASAEAPAPKSPAEQARDQVRALSNPKFTEREKAVQALERLGEASLEALKAAERSDDCEVRHRASLVRARVERQIENAKLLKAPTAHLKFESVAVRTAIAELNKKTGLNFHLDEKRVGNPNRAISVDTGEVPVWVAVDKVLEAAGLAEVDQAPTNTILNDGTSSTLQVGPQADVRVWTAWSSKPGGPASQANRITLVDGKSATPTFSSAAVRVRALPRDFPGNVVTKGSGEINITLDVAPLPSLQWQGLIGVEVRKAVTSDGRRLQQAHVQQEEGAMFADYSDGFGGLQRGGGLMMRQQVWVNDAVYDIGGSPGNPRHVSVSLLAPERPAKTLKELEGVVTARVLTPPQTILAVEDVLKADASNTYRADSLALQVLEVKKNQNGGVQVRVRYEMPSMMAMEMMQFNVRVRGRAMPFLALNGGDAAFGQGPPQFALHDADGKSFRLVNSGHMNSSDNGVMMTQEMQLTFQPGRGQKEPARLVLTGRRSVDVEVPFALKDVPLP